MLKIDIKNIKTNSQLSEVIIERNKCLNRFYGSYNRKNLNREQK